MRVCDMCGGPSTPDRVIRYRLDHPQGGTFLVVVKTWRANPKIETDLCAECRKKVVLKGVVEPWSEAEQEKYGK